MKKQTMKVSAFLCAVTLLFSSLITLNYVSAEETKSTESLEIAVDLISVTVSEDEDAEEVELDDILDEELLEAEPSELPEVAEDPALTEQLQGRMLLDVEGNGEVYYVDPVTGGKEYLANGESAQLMLRRSGLGINEENFANLIVGEEKDEESVCEENKLGNRLKGRIVLRTEKNGESFYILPTNCRAYYAGTFEASYQLMKQFSLGIAKKNLAKVPNNKRQKMKNALRLSVYAHAEDNDMDLKEARKDLKEEVNKVKICIDALRDANEEKPTKEEHRERVLTCTKQSGMPMIDEERRESIKENIQETRQERGEGKNKKSLKDFDMKKIFEKIKERRSERKSEKRNEKMNKREARKEITPQE